MSVTEFIEDAGQDLLTPMNGAKPEAPGRASSAEHNSAASAAIAHYIATQQLNAKNLTVRYDEASKTVTVKGIAPDQATKEKIVLCCGNVRLVARVDDRLALAQESPAFPPSTMYLVKSGDTLNTIANAVYGEGVGCEPILEANKPMLTTADKIYPGQQLRIPQKAGAG